MVDFAQSEFGAYLLTLLLAIGVGLIPTRRSLRGWVSVGLITFAFVVFALIHGAVAPWAGLIYVGVYLVTGVLASARDLADSPVVGGESYARRVLFALRSGHRLRVAEDAAARDSTTV